MKTNLKTFPLNDDVVYGTPIRFPKNKTVTLIAIINWRRDFEAEIRKIKDFSKPQRDQNEYNVYYLCKSILGEEMQGLEANVK